MVTQYTNYECHAKGPNIRRFALLKTLTNGLLQSLGYLFIVHFSLSFVSSREIICFGWYLPASGRGRDDLFVRFPALILVTRRMTEKATTCDINWIVNTFPSITIQASSALLCRWISRQEIKRSILMLLNPLPRTYWTPVVAFWLPVRAKANTEVAKVVDDETLSFSRSEIESRVLWPREGSAWWKRQKKKKEGRRDGEKDYETFCQFVILATLDVSYYTRHAIFY